MTKKKKAALLISSLALIAVIVLGGTLAYFTSQDDATNVFTLGKVSGDLTETTKEDTVDGHKVKPGTATDEGIEYEKVMPGDWLSKEPRVSLKADSEDAYVRVKLEVDVLEGTLNDGQKAEIISANCLNFGEKWVVSGDYIYYQDVLTTKSNGSSQTDPVFTIVKIPGKSWDNEAASAKFTIKVTADLIQADNFTPVKTDNVITGWGDVEIKK
ncbi:SipW-dependent-type signal peptide-containing protein [Eubacterium callanderi]|uniref:SipW-dependent-type signal peptide-containing protein n=1 Tax=Eubacterium callanderi TaxID=53442 RepID=UPI001C115E9B|nr:SipW-dependent-type signal peptide-containing protein [Eubacterium callanderi]MBU5302292.1 SipW-dependent-type signal peptide-containing protein [Eubacterium callanderi]WPK66358.1 hypothetical protein EUCA2A_04840 [Eubacterium callanderi]WPK70656.1 hypothetical protein EUCA11A_04840 [Eubacterium callanderi]